jgi:hypothetical protein
MRTEWPKYRIDVELAKRDPTTDSEAADSATSEVAQDLLRRILATEAAKRPSGRARHRLTPLSIPSRRVAVAVAALVLIAAVVVSIVMGSVGPQKQAAFAAWTPVPSLATSASTAAAKSACLQAVTSRNAPGAPIRQAALGGAPYGPYPKTWHVAIVDVRGPYILVDVEAKTRLAIDTSLCISGGQIGPGQLLSGEVTPDSELSRLQPDANGVRQWSSTWDGSPGPGISTVFGRVGTGIRAVTLHLKNGSTVVATIMSGYFAAWWPSNSNDISATVSTESGTRTQQFPRAVATTNGS